MRRQVTRNSSPKNPHYPRGHTCPPRISKQQNIDSLSATSHLPLFAFSPAVKKFFLRFSKAPPSLPRVRRTSHQLGETWTELSRLDGHRIDWGLTIYAWIMRGPCVDFKMDLITVGTRILWITVGIRIGSCLDFGDFWNGLLLDLDCKVESRSSGLVITSHRHRAPSCWLVRLTYAAHMAARAQGPPLQRKACQSPNTQEWTTSEPHLFAPA